MHAPLYSQEGKKVGDIELPERIFGLRWNADLVSQVVRSLEGIARVPIAHTKGRSEVRGGGKKPWRQKGTGRARHGSIRSPLWRGGGVTHGPRKEKKYGAKINKKMRRRALYVALSAKARDGEIIVVDELKFDQPKTRHAAMFLSGLSRSLNAPALLRKNGVLVALPEADPVIRRMFRNIPYAAVEEARNLNARDVLAHTHILFTRRVIEELKNK